VVGAHQILEWQRILNIRIKVYMRQKKNGYNPSKKYAIVI